MSRNFPEIKKSERKEEAACKTAFEMASSIQGLRDSKMWIT